MKKVESVLHVLMGFFCGLVGLHLLLTWREFKQLPPENDRYPVIETSGGDEYWAKARVMDTLQDSMEYVVGYTTATFTHLAIIVWLLALSTS